MMQLRKEIQVDNRRYVVVQTTKRRITAEILDGDFSDYRKRLGLSQTEFGEMLGGVSASEVSKMESGERAPSEEILSKAEGLLKQASAKKARGGK